MSAKNNKIPNRNNVPKQSPRIISSKQQSTPTQLHNKTPNTYSRDLNKTSCNTDKKVKKSENDSLLNTAFSLPSSASNTPTRSNKKIPSTVLNACYTPSSLFRPVTTPKSRLASSSATPKNRLATSSATPKSRFATPPVTPKSQLTTPSVTPRNRSETSSAALRYRLPTPTATLVRNKLPPSSSTTAISLQRTPECFSKVNLESPKHHTEAHEMSTTTKISLNPDTKGEISNLKVAVRVRPLNAQECLNPYVTNVVQVDGNKLLVRTGVTADNFGGVTHSFQYDHTFWSVDPDDRNYATQKSVFQGIGLPLVEKAFEGYNACLFAYGQTGSGKSYSMMGIETDNMDDLTQNSETGVIPRFCKEIFQKITTLKNVQAEVEVSYFEIYNEKIHDLLSVSSDNCSNQNQSRKSALRVREHPVWGPYVVGLSTQPVNCYESLRNWLAVGNSQRATAATGMNDQSSRSHSIFNIVLSISEIERTENGTTKFKETKRSKVSLVDLAGSERISNMETNGDRIREGVCINKSLLTLGKVIAALAADTTKKGTTFVPYRESVLTWLLRESLGGNSKTVMLATISPASIHLDETLATLRYACQARAVVNRVKVNEDPHDKIIRELRAEVERLKALRQDYERQKRLSANGNCSQSRKIIIETSSIADENEVETLRIQLAETERELAKAQKSWIERLNEAENQRKFEIRTLKRKGLALELSTEQKQPCLVNLAADPILSGILLYILPPGIVKIGRSTSSAFPQPDIVLDGPLVANLHCSIENINGSLFLIPENHDFETFLNGELVHQRQQIFDGDRLVIGGTHYFRVSNPYCTKRNTNNENPKIIDYKLAHEEILQKQEEKLRREFDEEKQIALAQIELEKAEHERNYREKFELLELEKFKYKCSKELLESEKKALQDKQKLIDNDKNFNYTPSIEYKSTLLDDIKRIMQNPTKESLHETKLMIKEANQRCRDLKFNHYEFKKSQIVDEFGIFRSVVIIIDRKNQLKAEWPIARLGVWLDFIRENYHQNMAMHKISEENLFSRVDINWNEIESNDCFDDTLNDSSLNSSLKISFNLNTMKDALFKLKSSGNSQKNSPSSTNKNDENSDYRKPLKNSNSPKNFSSPSVKYSKNNLKTIKKTLTYDDAGDINENIMNNDNNSEKRITKDNDFVLAASEYLKDLKKTTVKLKKLCDNYVRTDENLVNTNINSYVTNIEEFRKSIGQIDDTINSLRAKIINEDSKTQKSVRFLLDRH